MVKTPPPRRLRLRIAETMIALAGIPSVSGQEGAVREYVRERLTASASRRRWTARATSSRASLRQPAERDTEAPILLNAHLDRVPPGKAHTPIVQDGILRSDGETNLGADDSAGIAIILHTVEELPTRATVASAAAAALHRRRGGRAGRREGVRSQRRGARARASSSTTRASRARW